MKNSLYLVTSAAVMLFSTQASAEEIFVIQSYHAEYAWDAAYTKALEEKLGKNHKLSFFRMDTKRIPKAEYQAKADAAWAEYEKKKPDFVVLGDDNAVKFLGKRLAKTKTPVVFLGINRNVREYFEGRQLPNNFTGVLERPLMKRGIAQILPSLPNKKKILIMFDSGTTSQASIDQEIKKTNAIAGVKVDIKLIGQKDKWQQTIKDAKKNGYGAIFVGLYHTIKDANGKHVPAGEILSWTNKNSEVPLFAFWSFAVGKGKTAGGYLLDGYKMGEAAAELLTKYAAGQKPRVKVGEKGIYHFSKTELDRWGIKLPASIQGKTTFVD